MRSDPWRAYASGASTRVGPYHSISATGPGIHHVYGDCIAGRLIPTSDRGQGANGWPVCKVCADR